MRGALLIAAACLLLVFAGCGDDDSSTTSSAPSTTSPAGDETSAGQPAEPAKEKTKPRVTVPNGAPPKELVVKNLEVGTGPAAKAGDEVTVQYVGVGYDSEEEFDASWNRGEPFTFTLGAGEVIPGWDLGVEGMKVGGRRELVIPAELAYGATGSPPAIGPNETLIFVVDLEAVK